MKETNQKYKLEVNKKQKKANNNNSETTAIVVYYIYYLGFEKNKKSNGLS